MRGRATTLLAVAGAATILLLLYVAIPGAASSSRVYVVFDSCDCETVKTLLSLYPEARGEVYPLGGYPTHHCRWL